MSADLIVLGGGPAGLAAAWRAAERGLSVLLLERSAHLGGAAASVEVAGIRCDLGSHRLHPAADPRILAELRRLLGADLQSRPRDGRIRIDGRWLAFPFRLGQLARRPPIGLLADAGRDALTRRLRPPADDTFAGALRASLGPAICERFHFPMARKVWGLPPERLSAELARRRVSAGSPARIARRILSPGAAGKRTFLYPRRGYGQIAEAMAGAAEAAGARILTGAEARAIELRDGGAVVRFAGGEADAPAVLSTIPLAALGRMAAPGPAPEALVRAAGLRTRALALVYLVLPGARHTRHDAHYLPDPATPVTRISEPRNYRDADDPPDRTVLCAEVPCAADGPVWRSSDADLGEVAMDALRRSELPAPAPSQVRVIRLREAYPVMEVGYADALCGLQEWADAQPALLTFGRNGLFVHDNAHHAIATAWAAVDALGPDGRPDRGRWDRSRRGFAAHVVED